MANFEQTKLQAEVIYLLRLTHVSDCRDSFNFYKL